MAWWLDPAQGAHPSSVVSEVLFHCGVRCAAQVCREGGMRGRALHVSWWWSLPRQRGARPPAPRARPWEAPPEPQTSRAIPLPGFLLESVIISSRVLTPRDVCGPAPWGAGGRAAKVGNRKKTSPGRLSMPSSGGRARVFKMQTRVSWPSWRWEIELAGLGMEPWRKQNR